jgi:NADPH:quinone reductase-like Zn-dependent oxidoreductase
MASQRSDAAQMKAAVYRNYGPPGVVRIERVPKPGLERGEVLIRISATTVSSGDVRARSLRVPRGFGVFARPVFGMLGPRKPILGTELSGEIEAVGAGVTNFKVGDRVFAFPGFDMGCHAEYRTMPENGRISLLPPGYNFEEAAALSFGGFTAIAHLRHGAHLAPGEKLLVIGASGAVGSAAVQIAKHIGAHVTGVTSTVNVERVRGIGADEVCDYTQGDYLNHGPTYDVIYDTVGATDFAHCQRSLGDRGRLVLGAGSLPQLLSSTWGSLTTKHKVIAGPARNPAADMAFLKEVAERGPRKPMIDRSFPLDQIVDAHAYVDTGRKRGSVIITVDPGAA